MLGDSSITEEDILNLEVEMKRRNRNLDEIARKLQQFGRVGHGPRLPGVVWKPRKYGRARFPALTVYGGAPAKPPVEQRSLQVGPVLDTLEERPQFFITGRKGASLVPLERARPR